MRNVCNNVFFTLIEMIQNEASFSEIAGNFSFDLILKLACILQSY